MSTGHQGWWAPQEFADEFNVALNTVYHELKHGRIAGAVRIGRQWRILKDAFKASLTAEQQQESSEAR
jgi:excisionase family DNA binding protein